MNDRLGIIERSASIVFDHGLIWLEEKGKNGARARRDEQFL